MTGKSTDKDDKMNAQPESSWAFNNGCPAKTVCLFLNSSKLG